MHSVLLPFDNYQQTLLVIIKLRNIFCLGIYMSVTKPSTRFWKRLISTKWRNKLLIHNINLAVHRKSECRLRLLVSWRHEPMPCFGIGGPRLFLRVSATMISNCFVKLGIKVYFNILCKIWSRDDKYIT